VCRYLWALTLCACVGEIGVAARGSPGASPDAPTAVPDGDVAVAAADAQPPAAQPDARSPVVHPDAAPRPDAEPLPPGVCPDGTVPVDTTCMDLYEAPNIAGALPLVMYSFNEAEAWCGARGKRLCYDDEWTHACAGVDGWPEPYGPTRVPGECNDAHVWRVYNQSLLNGWPNGVSTPDVTSVSDLLDGARAIGPAAAAAADHVWSLYQGAGGGDTTGCVGAAGVYDLVGNVEEWTRRRDGGAPNFHGNLKGRYWAEARTCQSGVTTHADPFRFYEIGFRCCIDP
jgi:hypothetical protein